MPAAKEKIGLTDRSMQRLKKNPPPPGTTQNRVGRQPTDLAVRISDKGRREFRRGAPPRRR